MHLLKKHILENVKLEEYFAFDVEKSKNIFL